MTTQQLLEQAAAHRRCAAALSTAQRAAALEQMALSLIHILAASTFRTNTSMSPTRTACGRTCLLYTSGKSTLMKCLFGIYSKDTGEILLEGSPVHFKTSKEALESGVAMVHQELNQALKRNVMDNMWLCLLYTSRCV